MRLNFKTKMPYPPHHPTLFVERIRARIKIHTLREDAKKRLKEGMTLSMTTGSRYKPEVFNEDNIEGIQEVKLILKDSTNSVGYNLIIIVDGEELEGKTFDKFIENDGFDDLDDFVRWFFPDYIDGEWNGRCIHWTDLK